MGVINHILWGTTFNTLLILFLPYLVGQCCKILKLYQSVPVKKKSWWGQRQVAAGKVKPTR